ncbi:MAG: hypothetical protein COW04_00540 [Deltaproteobacteria bacterium CG12_big_fil_rev_8_21_14_0_65_43_10]|nr:MAG: hypothetical protein COW04_00540 [Deltaproteobacteria bacterium CG12_big_fil_rev_8_21_14_0_65_43_10]PIU86588.1 MAG: hypothetical protein COS67_01760 [Deltaproteobacteria bacterium CG06_land_8_20_14_3_00_44_19]PIX24452.1 MAG: hypothetical protein COZ68_06430 [Deltaproteobacteria bacterium CG_4_8_14_3_um_filter_43_13]PIZ19492.1 MAG: hypothetical protein COY50_09690 [Deltaproteobacteria bacterium CG_4_10_14_0_8_um_filter_43_12]PJB40537.1 MAG: hypothetical protein CO106_08260 [Deltaproteoba
MLILSLQNSKVTNGLPFKKALFGIWLCDNPAQKSLKREMLGTVGGVTVKGEQCMCIFKQ